MCVRETSHKALDCYSNNPDRLLHSPCAFGQSLYRVLIHELERGMHALAVMHSSNALCENVDSAKIKLTNIDILRMASMHHIVTHCIDVSMSP